MKHIWQSSQEHTSGSLDIAEDMPGFAPGVYLRAVLNLPISDGTKKLVSVCRGSNAVNLKKDFSEPPGVGSFGRSTAPGQALPLYMDQASLHHDIWPELAENPYHIRVAIHRKAVRAQTSRYKPLKEFQQLRLRILGDTVLTGYNHVSPGIHQGNKTAWAVKECPIQDKLLALPQAQHGLRRCLFHMVIDHTVKLPRTMSALARQLSDRVTFDHPAPKPRLLLGVPGSLIVPTTRLPTIRAEPTLFSISVPAIFPENS